MAENGHAQNGLPETWTVAGLLDYFHSIHTNMTDRSFAFVLGAGASCSSGIPTGGQLVNRWLGELKHRFVPETRNQPLEAWATEENLDIPGFSFDRAAESYSEVYVRRFRGDPEEGFAYLESIIEGKEPSIGYSVLAQILVKTRHHVVITTNFDNLIADAIVIYGKVHPLVCGHEALTQFVRVRMRRPLISKIHRDLLLSPLSDPDGTAVLASQWCVALGELFKHNIPIFIGYGGNDGSLMGFLEQLNPGDIMGRMLWCYRDQDGPPNERIRHLVQRHHGALIPILGFDEFMLELNAKLKFGLLASEIRESAEQRAAIYEKQLMEVMERLGQLRGEQKEAAKPVQEALEKTVHREAEKTEQRQPLPSTMLFNALLTQDPEARKRFYEEALAFYPRHGGLLMSYAQFAANELNDDAKARALYEEALARFPEDEHVLIPAARFFTSVADYARARALLGKVLELNPEHSVATSDLGLVLLCEGNDAEAETWFRRALDLNPRNARAMSNLAVILSYFSKRDEEAEQLFQQSVELAPEDKALLMNLAFFLLDQGRIDEAESWAESAWALPEKESNRLAARLALLRALLARLKGRDNAEELAYLKYFLKRGFRASGTWHYEKTLRVLGENLEAGDVAFYRALVRAVASGREVEELKSFRAWKTIQARSPNA